MLKTLKNRFPHYVVCSVLALSLITLTACSFGNRSAAGSEDGAQSNASSASSSASKSQDSQLELTPTQMRALQALISQPGTSPELARQAEIIMAVAGGMDNDEVMTKFGRDADTVDLKALMKQLQ